MAFPTSPTNGQTVVVNNITYQYANTTNSWSRILSTANVITANTLVSSGYISAAGNILTGNYFIGNGALLTGISTNPAAITNGTSNVSVVSSGGNVTVGIGGTSNVAVFATTGEYVTGIISASGNIISAGNVTGGNILTGGLISATGTLSVSGVTTLANLSAGNISSGAITSGGIVSAAGNITGGNLSGTNIAGTLTTAAQTNITSVGTLGSLAVTANVTGGNILTGGLVSAAGNVNGGNLLTAGLISSTGTVTGSSHLGSVVSVTANITGGNLLTGGLISGANNLIINAPSPAAEGAQIVMAWANISGVTGQANSTWNIDVDGTNNLRAFYQNAAGATSVLLSASPSSNILSFPSTAGISVSGNVNAGTNYFIGNGSQLTGISGGGGGTSISSGTSNVNVVSSGGNVTVGVGGTSNVAVFATTGEYVTGLLSVSGNIAGGNILTGGLVSSTGTVTGSSFLGSVVSVTANVTGGNILTGGLISATGRIFAASGNASAPGITFAADTGQDTGFYWVSDGIIGISTNATLRVTIDGSGNLSATGNVTGGNILTGGLISSTGNAIHSNVIINGTAAAGSGVLIVSGNIQTSTANATANIGNASNYFNRLFAQATTALYADLAEVYKADAQYPPGTVVVFGGTQEVTTSTESHDAKIAGVVSTNPAHVMNSGMTSEFTVEVGLVGRVPCRVIGPISAGDRVVSSNRAGVAERLDMSKYQPGVIIGKALESYSGTDVGTIEVVVGRL